MKHSNLAKVRFVYLIMKISGEFKCIFLISILLLSCENLLAGVDFDSIYQIPHPDRIRIFDHECYVQLGPRPIAERLQALETLKQLANKHGDKASAKLFEAHKLAVLIKRDTLNQIQNLKQLGSLAMQAGLMRHNVLELHILTMLADAYRDLGRIGSSITYCYKVYDLLELVKESLLPRSKDVMVWDLANAMYRIGDYNRTRTFIENTEQLHKLNHTGMMLCDLLSQVCWKLNDFTCARAAIQKGMDVYMKSDTTSWFFNGWRGIFWGNNAKIAWSEKNYQAAIPELQRAIEAVRNAKLYDNVSAFGLILSDCYLRTNQLEKAKSLLFEIKEDIFRNGKIQEKIDLYKLLLTIHQSSISIQQSIIWMDSLDQQKMLLFQDLQSNQQSREEFEGELNEYLKRKSLMETKLSQQLFLRNSLMILVGILFLAGVVLIYVKNNQVRKEKEIADQIRITGEQELKKAQQELSAFKEMLVQKNREWELAKEDYKNGTDATMLESMKNSSILTETGWRDFKKLFDRVYIGYRKRLKECIPNLTPAEERYLALLKLELNVKEIAATLGVGPGAIRTLKSRLMHKIKSVDLKGFEHLFSKSE